jgi:hypothetical protein
MKTTIEIPNAVLSDARKLAAREGTTLKALMEEGLRRILEERRERRKGKPFKLRDGSVGGEGLCPDVADGSWEKVRDLVYEGHGA